MSGEEREAVWGVTKVGVWGVNGEDVIEDMRWGLVG